MYQQKYLKQHAAAFPEVAAHTEINSAINLHCLP